MRTALVEPRSWNLQGLQRDVLDVLEHGGHPQGRLVAVLATPSAGSATELALGFIAIPAGKRTEQDGHRAEEIALILARTGTALIDDQASDVAPASVLLNPS